MTKASVSRIALLVLFLSFAPNLWAQSNMVSVSSEDLPDLPSSVRNPLLGSVDGRLVALGGWTGPIDSATWTDDVWALDEDEESWQKDSGIEGRVLPSAAAVTLGNTLILAGGQEAGAWSSATLVVERSGDHLTARSIPDLPAVLERPAGTANGQTVSIGGIISSAGSASLQVYQIDLAADTPEWSALPPTPLTGTGSLNFAFQNEGLFAAFGSDDESVFDLHRYTTVDGWMVRSEPESAIRVVAAMALGQAHIGFLSAPPMASQDSDEGLMAIYSYSTITDTWADIGHWEASSRDLAAVAAGTEVLTARHVEGMGGTQIGRAEVVVAKGNFGWLDYTIVALYLLAMIFVGLYFSKRETGTDDFFVGGRQMPWWAVGFSLYATGTSAVSFMAIPAKSYATDWLYLAQNVIGFIAIIPVALVIVPLIRRLSLTSTYEYLEMRFHVAVRLMGSVLCIVYQLGGRMSVVLFLPALALSAVTGVDVVPSILIMGLIATLYTVLGGIKAVIWTDVVQVLVLFGGALLCLVIIVTSVEGGLFGLLEVVQADNKMHLFDFRFDFTIPTVWLFVIVATADTITWPRDQVMVQRVLSTKSAKEAGFSVWTLAAIVVPGSVMFFSLGTALYGFYKLNPEKLSPLLDLDATFPFFIASELPMGLTGLIIAALFAASMSTLDSSMNSVSTVVVVDFYNRFRKSVSDAESLRIAKWITVITGILGTVFALILSRYSLPSILDTFLALFGLLGGGFAGVYSLGMFTRRANWQGALTGTIASIFMVLAVQAWTEIHVILYGGVAIITCVVVGYLVSLLFPIQEDRLKGLTVYKVDKNH